MDKRERAAIFRQRIVQIMEREGISRSALARHIGCDRSTIGQLLVDGETRLPNSQLAADAASFLGVSTDWLLGLTDRPERPGDLVEAAVSVTKAERTAADQQIIDWLHEAAGYKVRHVPATLPEVFKTEDVLRWEYAAFLGKTPDQAIRAMRQQIDWAHAGNSDYEIALPLHEVQAFATGSGYYEGLEPGVRRAQLDRLATLSNTLFPATRVFLFDAREVFSAPLTVFGPVLAVIYIGRFHLAFRESRRVRSLTEQFDWLVREAKVDARHAADYFAALKDKV